MFHLILLENKFIMPSGRDAQSAGSSVQTIYACPLTGSIIPLDAASFPRMLTIITVEHLDYNTTIIKSQLGYTGAIGLNIRI
jgi:hypothetical protein